MKPDDPHAKIKFLVVETLREGGGLVFDTNRDRFANELGRRNFLIGEVWNNEHPFRLAPNRAITWQFKHYTGRRVMKIHESGAALAGDMGVPVSKMQDSIGAHIQATLKTAHDPDGGPKSWDEVPGKTSSGKKFHRNVISGADFTAPQS